MIAISNIFHEYKHLLPIQSQNKYLFEINRNNKSQIYVNMYKHQTLTDLHKNIRLAFYPLSSQTPSTTSTEFPRKTSAFAALNASVFLQSFEMVELKAHSHEHYTNTNTNTNKNKNDSSCIHDIFIFNNKTEKILSIPQDNSITLIEFIDSNQDYFTTLYFTPFPDIYKIYVIDNEYIK